MTAVAQAQANDEGKDARRPPTERQVGESWRNRHVAPGSQTTTDPAAQRALARQRYWYYQSTLASRKQTAELSRRGEQASQEQTTSDAALRRQPARERFSIPQRDTRPAARPSAGQIQWTAWVAPRFTRRAGRARRQTGRPQSPCRARGLTTVTVRPPCRRWVVGIPCPQATASRPCAGPDEVVRTHPLAPDGRQ
jgi:hypothetical protein